MQVSHGDLCLDKAEGSVLCFSTKVYAVHTWTVDALSSVSSECVVAQVWRGSGIPKEKRRRKSEAPLFPAVFINLPQKQWGELCVLIALCLCCFRYVPASLRDVSLSVSHVFIFAVFQLQDQIS